MSAVIVCSVLCVQLYPRPAYLCYSHVVTYVATLCLLHSLDTVTMATSTRAYVYDTDTVCVDASSCNNFIEK